MYLLSLGKSSFVEVKTNLGSTISETDGDYRVERIKCKTIAKNVAPKSPVPIFVLTSTVFSSLSMLSMLVPTGY